MVSIRRLSKLMVQNPSAWMLALVLLLGGCASQTSKLTLTPVHGVEALTQSFPTAYAGRSESGDFQVVLLNDGLHAAEGDAADPIEPTTTPPLRQVVEVRVFWRPMRGTKPDFPAAANAAIDWYVFGVGSRESTDMVHYQGTGFAEVGGSDAHPTIRIRHATLATVARVGHIGDPIGLARIKGAIHARVNLRELALLQESVQKSAGRAVASAQERPTIQEATAIAR